MTAVLACFAFAVGIASGTAEPTFPGASWQQKTPAELGLDKDRLEAVAAALGGRGCIVKDGYVVHQWGDQAQKADWLSCAKPVLSTLLLFAVQEGKVKSVDTPIAEFGWELSPKDRTMTFRHLANMTSGYARPEEPGKAWAYNDFAIQLYQKTLFDRVFKDDADKVANSKERLGGLGLEDGLSFTPDRRRMKASVRDFARIAWFWLQSRQVAGPAVAAGSATSTNTCGRRRPRTCPSRSRPRRTTTSRSARYGGGSEHFTRFGAGIYGFNWWFNGTGGQHPDKPTWPDAPADTVMSIGAGGNNSVLMPKLNLIVACAQGDWGKLEGGASDSVLNQRLKLIAWAGTPAEQPHRAK